jgi:type III restriction enzyme
MPFINPILNHPYAPPRRHYHTAADGSLDYGRILDGRRRYRPELSALPVGAEPQGDFGEWLSDDACQAHPINLLRREVGAWRDSGYQQPASPTWVTWELLEFWFDPARQPQRRLFFAQREAIETAIYLNEIADKANVGTHLLSLLRAAQNRRQ